MSQAKTFLQNGAEAWLRRARLRPTRQRRALATLLCGGGQRHIDAESLYAEAIENGVEVSLATIYNALRQFTDAGLLREVHCDASRVYYDTRTDDHPHFFIEETGAILDAPAYSMRLDHLPEPPEGYEICGVDIALRLRKKSESE